MIQLQTILLSLYLLLQLLPVATAHGTPYQTFPDDGKTTIGAPLAGAREFFATLAAAAYQLDSDQLEHVSTIGQFFQVEKQLRDGQVSGARPVDADYNQFLAHQALLNFVQNDWPDLISLNLRQPDATDFRELNLPALEGIMIFKLSLGDGPIVFDVQHADVGSEGIQGSLPLRVPQAGTVYALVRLTNLRANDLSRVTFAWTIAGEATPRFWNGVALRTPQCGQLQLEVVDEKGANAPVFVRLTGPQGRFWEPPNAVDLGPIMTHITGLNIYGPGRGYTHFLPGEFRGAYWVLPGPMTSVIPAGEWEVAVQHGVEYVPVRQRVTIRPGEKSFARIRLQRWTNMPAQGWYSGDDHIHARMINSTDVDGIMAFVRAADINVANILEMGNENRTWYAQAGFGPGFRHQQGAHVLVPGQEDPRSLFGHTIGLNLRQLVRSLDKYYSTDLLADEMHAQGGLYGHTHVGEGGLGVHRDMTLQMPDAKSDFASIMQNRLGTDLYYEFLNLGFKLVASAGTDTPYGGAVGITRVYAYLGPGVPFSADAWFDAFKRGRTFVTSGPLIDFKVDDSLPGAEISITGPRRLRMRGAVHGRPGGSAPNMIRVIESGSVLKEFTSPDPGRKTLRFDFETSTTFGGWFALEASGHDGSQAHTTPVYVTREGFRHWNPSRATAMIDIRLQTLDEMDRMAAEKEQLLQAGQLASLDRYSRLLAEQAPAIRERTRAARRQYLQLRSVLEQELTRRAGMEKETRSK